MADKFIVSLVGMFSVLGVTDLVLVRKAMFIQLPHLVKIVTGKMCICYAS